MTVTAHRSPLTFHPNSNPNPNPNQAKELEKPVVVKFDLFDTVTYHGKVPKGNKVEEECKQKLAIMRHQLESMATHVAAGADTYSSIQVYYIDDRRT